LSIALVTRYPPIFGRTQIWEYVELETFTRIYIAVYGSARNHEIAIAPAFDHRGERLAGRFDARLWRTILVRGTKTPSFYDSARALLVAGLAETDDVVVMRHAGMQHTRLESAVGKAAKLAETQTFPST
jgi:hypothetical protein